MVTANITRDLSSFSRFLKYFYCIFSLFYTSSGEVTGNEGGNKRRDKQQRGDHMVSVFNPFVQQDASFFCCFLSINRAHTVPRCVLSQLKTKAE